MAELAKLDVLISGDIKPLVIALNEGKTAIEGFEEVGADAFLNLNAGLSKTAQAALAAGNDIKSLTLALDVLQAEQANIVKGTTLWQLYETEIKKVNAQLDVLEAQLPIVATETKAVGNAGSSGFSAMGKSIGSVLTPIRQLAYILPGIGLAGLFNLAFEAIAKAADELGIFNDEAKELAAANTKAIESFSDEANQVTILVARLREENTTREEKGKLIKQLQDLSPAYFSNLRLEGDEIVNLTGDYANFGRAILLVAKIKAASELNQKNVTAQIQEQLRTSQALALLEQKRAFLEANNLNFRDEQLKLLERQLEDQTRLFQISKPLLDIIIEAQRELDALGGTPFAKSSEETINKVKEQTKVLEKSFQTIKENQLSIIDTNKQIENFAVPNIPAIPSIKGINNDDEATKTLKKVRAEINLATEAAQELGDAFAATFKQLVTSGTLSFRAIENALTSLIAKLIATVIEAAILSLILNTIFPGSGAAISGGAGFANLFKGLLGFADGGIVGGPMIAKVGESGPEAIIPLSQLSTMVSNLGGGTQRIEVVGRISGQDIVLVQNRQNLRNNRNYGSNFGN